VKRWMALMLAAAMLAMGLAGCGQPKLEGGTLALVNGRTITKDDLNTRLKIFELFFQESFDTLDKKQQVLDQMIVDQLLRDQAQDLGVKVDDAAVEGEMAKFFGSLDRTYKSRDTVNAKLQELGLTNDAIAGFLKDFLAGQAVSEKKKAEVQVTDSELQAYYEKKKEALYTFKEDVVRAAHVLVPLDQEAKAQEIAAKAKAGGNLAELARLYSIDPVSSQHGGDLGYFTRSSMVKEFSDAAFGMDPGRTSDPVRTQFGWHIIHVIDKQAPGTLPYDKAAEDVHLRVLTEKQDQAYQQWLTSVEKNAKIVRANLAE
jgi:parvulin-like peptidyl-prolyl isomerase